MSVLCPRLEAHYAKTRDTLALGVHHAHLRSALHSLKIRMLFDCLQRYLHEAGSGMQLVCRMPCSIFYAALSLLAFTIYGETDLHYVN